mgnify:CR=1 FL=1
MTENSDFKTFLSISSNKFGIYLVETKNYKVLYEKDFTVENEYSTTDFNNLEKFLKENIFKIEKLIKEFLKNIFLIIDHEKIINHVIGIKKKNLNTKYLTNVLTEAKDLFNKNYNDHKIMHIIINKILIDGNYYPKFLSDIEAKDISLEIQFIAIPKVLSSEYEKILEYYQIKITSYLDKKYIQNFCSQSEIGIPSMALKILNGYNINEVKLVPKNIKKPGFFEKFFQLFS